MTKVLCQGVRLVLAVLFLVISAGMPAAFGEERTVRVTLVLICDIYEIKEREGRGGFARLASAIKTERARHANVIVAHAGDTISPSLFSGFDQGRHIIDLTNMLSPDIFVPGNHEFDFGEDVYRQRMSEARFPVLAANLRDDKGKRLSGHKDVRVFDIDGIKIAVIGLTADDSPRKSSPGSLRFEPTVPSARRMASEVRANGADLVVAVAHANRRQDLRLFYSSPVDVLLSGDDHDLALLYDGKSVLAEAMSDGEFVVAVDLEITVRKGDEGARSVSWRPRFRIIDTASVAPDPEVAARVASHEQRLSKELDVPLGETAVSLDSRASTVRMSEAAIGNLIADAMRERSGADVAIMNGGGIRGNKVYQAGTTLTRRDVLTELPFGNKLIVVRMTGAELMNVLENGLWFAGKPNGRFAQISGLKVTADGESAPGRRIQSVDIGGRPLEPDTSYTVATNEFIASGKEGYDVFRNAERLLGETDAPLVANVVMHYIRKQGTVRPEVEGRIIIN